MSVHPCHAVAPWRSTRDSLLLSLILGVPAVLHAQTAPDFEGVWSTTMTTPQDEAWRIEDFGCFVGCMAATYEHLRALVNDPANDDRPFGELVDEAWRHGADGFAATLTPAGRALRDEIGFGDEAAIACEPTGFMRQVLNPLPLEITQYDDRLLLRYEGYEGENAVRTVYLDGRAPPPDTLPSRLGHSTGRFEDAVLVIETEGILPGEYWPEAGGGGHSEALRTVERYTRSDDGSWLRLEVTFDDLVMLTEPMVYEMVWRFTPDVEILETGGCEVITGQP